MKTKNQIIISLAIATLLVLVGFSSAHASESSWQNLNQGLESGLTGTVTNCSPLSVSNGTVAAYPSCAITCNSGYSLSGSSCIIGGGGGGGGGGGASITATPVSAIGSVGISVPMVVTNTQTGSLSQSFSGGVKVELTVPKGAVSTATTFSATVGSLTSALTPVSAAGAFMVGNQVFNVTAVSSSGVVRNFAGNLIITLTVPAQPSDTSNLGVYYFNDTSNQWVLVPGAVFNTNGTVTFQVNHLTKFAIFNVVGQPSVVAVAAEVTSPVTTDPDSEDASPATATFIALEKSLVKKVSSALSKRLTGRILLQVEEKGQAWYINPVNNLKYFLNRPTDAFTIMRQLSLGISNKDFDSFKGRAPARLAGRILLKVQAAGEAYYVNPLDLSMHYLGRPADAFNVMRSLGLGITNTNLRQIGVGEVK